MNIRSNKFVEIGYENRMFAKASVFFYAFFLFSGFSNYIFDVNGLYFFEAAAVFVFLYWLVRNDEVGGVFKSSFFEYYQNICLAIIFLVMLLLLGWINGESFANAYTDFRASLFAPIGFAFAAYCYKNNKINLLGWFGLATGLLSVAYWFFSYYTGRLEVKFATPIIACVVAVFVFSKLKKTKEMAISALCLFFLAAVSFYRQYWIYGVLSILFVVAGRKSHSVKGGVFSVIGLLVTALVFVFLGYDLFMSIVYADESYYIQSIGKTDDLLNYLNGSRDLTESDAIRLGYFEYLFSFWYELLLPHGLGYKSFFDNIDPWFYQYSIEANTIDSLLFYMVFHYGWLMAGWMLLTYFHGFYLAAKKSSYFEYAIMLCVLLVVIFFDGAQATIINRAFWLGCFCAFCIFSNKESS